MAYIKKFNRDNDKWWKNYPHHVIISHNFALSMQLLYYFGFDPKSKFDQVRKKVNFKAILFQ